MEDLPITTLVASLGFAVGIVFGATAQRTNFCTMGAISDIMFMWNWSRFRSWLLAMAVAIIGSQLLFMSETVDLTKSIYLTRNFGWAGAIIGGVLFGFGMTLAGGCGNKTLVRLGGGNLKSIVVTLFMAIFAYMTLRGLIGLARVELEALTNINLEGTGLASQSLPAMLTAAAGLDANSTQWLVASVAVIGILWFCFKDAEFRASGNLVVGGLVIGLIIPASWYITGVIGNDEFSPVPLASVSFVAPVGESLQYLLTFTGSTINFGIGTVGGVIVGAFLMAKMTGTFRIESFVDANDLLRHMVGGAIMGIGGVLALGCTVGQGLTGISTLAAGSVIALLSIIGGGILGMKYLEEGSLGAALGAVFSRR